MVEFLEQSSFINNSGWCDYVFEADYELMPLEDVDAHIQEKGHLHNTPSAEEIEGTRRIRTR